MLLLLHSLIMQKILDPKALSDSLLFENLSEEALSEIVSSMRLESWKKGYSFPCFTTSEPYFYILVRGRVKVSRQHDSTGRELTLFVHGPGDGFNILNMIDGGNTEFFVTALDDVDVLSAPISLWINWLDKFPSLRTKMAGIASKQIKKLADLSSELALEDTMARLIHLLVKYLNEDESGVNLIQNLPQEELANMIGTVRPVVARLLGELKREGLIDNHGGVIHINNLSKLLDKAENHLK